MCGLIPAHAGKTRYRRRVVREEPAHPRSRGENLLVYVVTLSRGGSSPLTRGKRYKTVITASDVGLIPAHAGKTHM